MEAALEVMNQQMVKEAKKFDSKAIEKAIEIALSMGGNMTGASKKIEQIAKGLSGEQKVKDALRLANESVEVTEAKNEFYSQVVDIVTDLQDRVVDDLMDRVDDLDPSDRAVSIIDKALSKETKKAVQSIMRTLDNAKLTESVEVTEAKVTVNVDWMGDIKDPATSKPLKQHKIKIKVKGGTADLTGDKKDVAKYLQAVHHAGEYKTVQDLLDDGLYSELEESVVTEAQKKTNIGLKTDVGIAMFSGDSRGIKNAISYAAKHSKMKKSDFIIFQGPFIGSDGMAYPDTKKTHVVNAKQDPNIVKVLTKAGAEKISTFSGGKELEESVVTEASMAGMYERIEKLADEVAALGKKDKSAKRELAAVVKHLDAASQVMNQLAMSQMESVEVTEAIDAAHPTSRYRGREQLKLSKFLRKTTGTEKVYFDGANLVVGSKTALAGALNPAKKFTVQDLIDAVKNFKESVQEAQSGGKEAYAKFFKGALKKFDVKSVAELDDEKKKEFFNYVDKEWEGTNEDD